MSLQECWCSSPLWLKKFDLPCLDPWTGEGVIEWSFLAASNFRKGRAFICWLCQRLIQNSNWHFLCVPAACFTVWKEQACWLGRLCLALCCAVGMDSWEVSSSYMKCFNYQTDLRNQMFATCLSSTEVCSSVLPLSYDTLLSGFRLGYSEGYWMIQSGLPFHGLVFALFHLKYAYWKA